MHGTTNLNRLNPELNPICYLLALLGAHHFLHVSRIRVKYKKSLSSSSSKQTLRYTTFTYLSGPIFVLCDVGHVPDLRHLNKLNHFSGYIKMVGRGAQTPDARLPERLDFCISFQNTWGSSA